MWPTASSGSGLSTCPVFELMPSLPEHLIANDWTLPTFKTMNLCFDLQLLSTPLQRTFYKKFLIESQ
jgi:hypothetical protein